MKLYEITGKLLELQNILENQTEENDVKMLEDTMESMSFEFEDKIEDCVKVLRNIEASCNACEAEEKRFAERKKKLRKSYEWLLDYMKRNIEAAGKENIETELFKLSIKRNPPKIFIAAEENVPAEFMKINYIVDKTELKKALLNEQQAEALNKLGIRLETGTRLDIK